MTKLEILKRETDELLEQEIFSFNKSKKQENYLPDYLKSLLKEYNTILNNERFWISFCDIHYPNMRNEGLGNNIFRQIIQDFSKKIIDCLNDYYLGKVSSAYNHLCDGLNKKIAYKTSILFKNGIREYDFYELLLYRMRLNNDENEEPFDRKNMFHIPFQLRHNIKTQRYSIPGHPCLYLGDSSFVCWKELSEPKINNVYVSKFSNSKKIKLIEILSRTEIKKRLSQLKNDTEYTSELFRYLLMFPLNIACSIKSKKRNALFKSEYIIPQLFLQYITEHQEHIDGIKYYSTLVDEERIENVEFDNFVFPTKSNKHKGYCNQLVDKFVLTEPILWKYEEINHGNVVYIRDNPRNEVKIELIKGRKTLYDDTTFMAIENTLNYNSMELKKLSDVD